MTRDEIKGNKRVYSTSVRKKEKIGTKKITNIKDQCVIT
jgi:hypothetical protein